MSVIDASDKQKVVSVAEGGVPVTGAMIDEWCAAYDRGLPEDYEVEGSCAEGADLYRQVNAMVAAGASDPIGEKDLFARVRPGSYRPS